MSRRLLRLQIPLFLERRMFRVFDSSVDPDAPGAPLPPIGAFVSGNREQLWIGSLQEYVGVRFTMEEWDAAPPMFGDGWEDEAKGVLYLRGHLSVDMGKGCEAVRALRLASGVGDYNVRVYARNRGEVVRRYQELFERQIDPLGDEFGQARRQLEGLEQYLVQIWKKS